MEKKLKLRSILDIRKSKLRTESYPTRTSEEQVNYCLTIKYFYCILSFLQADVEDIVLRKYEDLHIKLKINPNLPELFKEQHTKFLVESMVYLPSAYEVIVHLY